MRVVCAVVVCAVVRVCGLWYGGWRGMCGACGVCVCVCVCVQCVVYAVCGMYGEVEGAQGW